MAGRMAESTAAFGLLPSSDQKAISSQSAAQIVRPRIVRNDAVLISIFTLLVSSISSAVCQRAPKSPRMWAFKIP